MKVETPQKPKNQFQLELDAKMKDRRSRGLTTALSPSPPNPNQDSIVISDDEDDILTSLQQSSYKSMPNYKSKLNSTHLNETMQWGDSQYWNSFLHKEDKINDSLDIRNRKSPSWKESPRSGENQKGYLKSKLSPRNNVEIDSLQIQNSPRNFKEVPSKLDIKNSPRGDYKPERKKFSSYSDYVEDSPRSSGSVIDQSLSSVSEAHNTTSGQRFLKSNKKVKSVEKDQEKTIQDEIDSPRPVPRVRKKSLTSPRYVRPQELQTEENILSVINNDSDHPNSGLSSARMRRHASKASASSPVPQDNLNLSSGKNSPSVLDLKKTESPKSPKDKDISLSEKREKMKAMHTLGNKHSFGIKDANRNKNDPELNETKTKKERQEKSTSLDKQSSRKVTTANENNKTFSMENKSADDELDGLKPSFSRRGSLQMQNKTNENKDRSKLNSATRTSPQNRSFVFDFLTEDIVEPKPTMQKQKSLENKAQFLPFATDSIDGVIFDKDTSSLCDEPITELRPTPIPRKNKDQWTPDDCKVKTENQIYEEAIQQVEDFQNSQTDSPNKTVRKAKPTSSKPSKNLGDKSAVLLDTNLLREEIFQEWKTQKNKLIKEQKKKKIEEEEKKKKALEDKKKDAAASFECWKKQKDPILKQKLKIEKTEQEVEFEKRQKNLEKKQEAAKLYELWKKEKDALLRKEYSKKKEEEQRKNRLLNSNKEDKQKHNVSSFNTWKQTKDKVLLQRKKEELKTTTLMQKQHNYVKIQKETLSEESYQQWLWRKEEREKEELKKKRQLRHLGNSYAAEPQQAWRPPSRTIPC